MWRFCSALKNSHFTRAFNIGHLGTFSRPQLLILAVSAVVVGLQAVTFAVPHHIVSLNIRGPILAFSNSLAYLVVFIPEYRVRKHRVRKYTIFSRIEEDETPERARKQARGVLVTTILACLAVMASLSLLAAVLTGNCTWRSFVLVSRLPVLSSLSNVASGRLSQHASAQDRGLCCKAGRAFSWFKVQESYMVVLNLSSGRRLALDFGLSIFCIMVFALCQSCCLWTEAEELRKPRTVKGAKATLPPSLGGKDQTPKSVQSII